MVTFFYVFQRKIRIRLEKAPATRILIRNVETVVNTCLK